MLISGRSKSLLLSRLIESPDGAIIDCVLFHHQPAFDLPEFRGTMSMDPPKLPKGHDNRIIRSEMKQLWSSNGDSCPNGTIPIRRTSASDMLRSHSISKYGKKLISAKNNSSGQRHEHGLGYLWGKEYYGIKAILNVWAPNVTNKDDFSLSQIWVISDIPNHDVNVIEAGLMVYPRLYGDNSPRLFIYWTDPNSGNWWLSLDGNQIGYWPSALIPSLGDHATMIQFGVR
ncbi:hypothetical protein L1987_79508 [Smallanthus sonchifolius]|uniref:Uncharacterized protein n=1 Tax=Smallanthus sonchifolius TaxID=185202 RepID=A0ACB8ZK32_9ASTR|nr:hypothetical protein L1987_79508 [Smallanthus sonchifolius]